MFRDTAIMRHQCAEGRFERRSTHNYTLFIVTVC